MSDGIPKWNPSGDARARRDRAPSQKRTTARKAPTFRLTLDELEERANSFIETIGGGAMMTSTGALAADGVVLVSESETLAKSWRDLAEINPYVRKFLDSLLFGGKTMEALWPTVAVTLSILANHGRTIPMMPITPFAMHEARANAKIERKLKEVFEEMNPEERAAAEAAMASNGGAA